MKIGKDITSKFPGLFLVHHNLPGKSIEKQNDEVHHLIIPLSGEIKVETKGKALVLGPGKMVYIPCKSSHKFTSSDKGSGERLVAIIDDKLWKKQKSEFFEPRILPTQNLIRELILYLLLNPKHEKPQHLIITLIQTLVDQMQTLAEDNLNLDYLESSTTDERLLRALSYLEKKKMETLKMEELAKVSGMSQRNFNRLFYLNFKVTPKQLHSKLRMEEAYHQISTSKRSVTQVAFDLGYNSLSQFIKVFHHTYGKLPSEV
jgi:AraC-like DNA-binding protein/mannose-6-phosphate isomerase-like protein (cupin superfamily)